MDSMRQNLSTILVGFEDELWSVVQAQVDALSTFNTNLKEITAAEGAEINAEFAAASDAEAAAKNASMDTLEQKWAYWLK